MFIYIFFIILCGSSHHLFSMENQSNTVSKPEDEILISRAFFDEAREKKHKMHAMDNNYLRLKGKIEYAAIGSDGKLAILTRGKQTVSSQKALSAFRHEIHILDPKKTLLPESHEPFYIQNEKYSTDIKGITFNSDNSSLYVAKRKKMTSIDLHDRKETELWKFKQDCWKAAHLDPHLAVLKMSDGLNDELFQTTTGKEFGIPSKSTPLGIHPEGKLFTGKHRTMITIHQPHKDYQHEKKTIEGCYSDATFVRWSTTGNLIIALNNTTVFVCDANKYSVLQTLQFPREKGICPVIADSAGDHYLALGYDNLTKEDRYLEIKIFSMENYKIFVEFKLTHGSSFKLLRFAEDGHKLVAVTNKAIESFDVSNLYDKLSSIHSSTNTASQASLFTNLINRCNLIPKTSDRFHERLWLFFAYLFNYYKR